MSQILQLTDEQLIMYGAKAYKDGFIAAKKEELELHKKEWVNEDEAMKILHCKKPTLAKYRSESVITYRGYRPIEYERASLEAFINTKLSKASRTA